jgi:serine/threonine protein kinase
MIDYLSGFLQKKEAQYLVHTLVIDFQKVSPPQSTRGRENRVMIGPWQVKRKRSPRKFYDVFDVVLAEADGELWEELPLAHQQRITCLAPPGTLVTLKRCHDGDNSWNYEGSLRHEASLLESLSGSNVVPELLSCHKWKEESLTLVVSPAFGENLSELLRRQPRHHIPMYPCCELAKSMIKCIAALHEKGYVHRDIKPSVFVRKGSPLSSELMLVDLNYCKKLYIPASEEERKKMQDERRKNGGKKHKGHINYLSPLPQRGEDFSFRDDVYSMTFVFIELVLGNLPWIRGGDIRSDEDSLRRKLLIVKGKKELWKHDFAMSVRMLGIFDYLRKVDYGEVPDFPYVEEKFDTLQRMYLEGESFNWDPPPPLDSEHQIRAPSSTPSKPKPEGGIPPDSATTYEAKLKEKNALSLKLLEDRLGKAQDEKGSRPAKAWRPIANECVMMLHKHKKQKDTETTNSLLDLIRKVYSFAQDRSNFMDEGHYELPDDEFHSIQDTLTQVMSVLGEWMPFDDPSQAKLQLPQFQSFGAGGSSSF